MGFRLRLRFHGSIALVPNPDKSAVTMLIGKFDGLVPHVKFPAESLRSHPNRKLHEPPARSMGDRNLRHIVLDDGERLTLNAKVAGQHLTLNESVDPSPTPVPSTMFSLEWLPHIARIEDKTTGTIDPAMMQFPQPDVEKRGIAARIDLTRGYLQTTGILDPVLVDFVAPGRPAVTTAIAREAELLLDVDDDRVVLESDSLFEERGQARDASRDMTFLANGSSELTIVIGNEPADEIHQPIPIVRTDEEQDRDVAREFRMLYEFSANKNLVNPRLPRVSARRPSGTLCVIPIYTLGDE